MNFVKIHTATQTTVEEMFTLGVSTSRGTENIGQFGSGSLMSSILWLRTFGESPVFFINGEKVTFEIDERQKTDGATYGQIMMKRGRKKLPMSVSLEYGEKDWTSPEMALREWISNAIDQGATIEQSVSVVNSVKPTDGVCVYVRQVNQTREYLNDLERQFLHTSGNNVAKVIEKSEPGGKLRAYRRGVFLRELNNVSLFDYNLEFDVNESRNGSSDSMESMIKDIVSGSNYHNPEYYNTILNAVISGTPCFEVDNVSSWNWLSGDWRDVLAKFNQKVYPIAAAMLQCEGMEGIPICQNWYDLIVRCCPSLDGMRDVNTSAKKGLIGTEVTSGPTFEMMRNLWNVVWSCGLTEKTELPKLEIFKTADGQQSDKLGYYDRDTDTIGIFHDNRLSMSTMIEEVAHRASGKSDRTREFQTFLCELTARVIGDTSIS